MRVPDWDKINVKKRWEILQGQTLNMAWNDIIAEQQQSKQPMNFKEKLETLKLRYPELLEVNARLISEEGGKPSSVSGGGKSA